MSGDDDDFGTDIDDEEFVALATQAEQQSSARSREPALDDSWPSDDFAELDSDDLAESDFVPAAQRNRVPAAPRGSLRQTTLFGSQALENHQPAAQPPPPPQRNWPLANSQSNEQPTHHKIDTEAAKTWIYPLNLGFRDYQFNIVHRALLSNLLCALPTGLGKTFIAATVMLNWYRWAPEGQIIFMAPTKPLVHQQIEACYQIAGIPRSQTAVLTGGLRKDVRHEYWVERRVFFMTPQTVQMDLSHGLCDPKRIVCLVVDEAHRATGNYAYVDVIKRIRQHNTSFRVLALTATPGSTIEGVQNVVDSLGISKVEIRTDESLDIRQYVQKRTLNVQSFPLSDELQEIHDLYCKCLEPMLKILNNAKAYYQTRPESLSVFGMMTARTQFMNSPAARNMNQGFYWSLVKTFFDLTVLAHPLNLLTSHGVRLFYGKLTQQSLDVDDWDKDDKARKRRDTAFNALRTEQPYAELLERTKALVDDPNFSGHPKMDHMIGSILTHFSEAEDSGPTKIIVFTSYRDSAEEACRLLRRHEPMIRPHVFVGQARSQKSAGMSQKEQLEIVQKFQEGTYNTLVATSIGEEGLDIGEVDLIVCYDTSSSPIRLLQRMGRTGRKRAGGVLVLLTEGKEYENYRRAVDNYQYMQKKIAAKNDFVFPHDLSPRILPKGIDPQPDKQAVEIPVENSQPEPPRKRPRVKRKAPAKKLFMPEGVKTGFTKASRIGKGAALSSGAESDEGPTKEEEEEEEAATPLLDDNEGLLTQQETDELYQRYQKDWASSQDVVVVQPPDLERSRYPERQRVLQKTGVVGHGRRAVGMVNALKCMHDMGPNRVEELKEAFDPSLLKDPPKTKPFKPVRPVGGAKATVRREKPTALGQKAGSANVETIAIDDDNDDEGLEITAVKHATTRKKLARPTTKGKGSSKKRHSPACTTTEDDDEALRKPDSPGSKRRISGSDDEDMSRASAAAVVDSDADSLPDPSDLLSSFRFVGSGKKVRIK